MTHPRRLIDTNSAHQKKGSKFRPTLDPRMARIAVFRVYLAGPFLWLLAIAYASSDAHRNWTFTQLVESSARPVSGASVVVGSTLYQIGGCFYDVFIPQEVATMYTYNLATMADGKELTSMPTARYNLAAGAINNVIYAVGGAAKGPLPEAWQIATVEAYTVATGRWNRLPSMPTPREGLGVAVINGLLYAVGGYTMIANQYTANTPALESFNPTTAEWKVLEGMPTPRSFFATGAIGTVLYTAGGQAGTTSGNTSTIVSTMEAYNTITGKWASLQEMPTARSTPGGAVLNGVFYVTGGVELRPLFCTNKSESFSPTDGWTKLQDLPKEGDQVMVALWYNNVVVIGSTMYGAMQLSDPTATTLVIGGFGCTPGWGELDCNNCDAAHWGTSCSEAVTCNLAHGTCLSPTCNGTTGTGHCSTCLQGFNGPTCSLANTCNINHGTCSPTTCSGPAGNGHCSACSPGWELASDCTYCDASHFGSTCAAITCNTNHGTCAPTACSGAKGNGHCSTCSTGWTLASDCTDCDANHFGSTCIPTSCNLNHGSCESTTCSGTKGNGACSTCLAGFHGPTCGAAITCNTTHGICSVGTCSGPRGTGNCSSCDSTHFGLDCTTNVTCSAAHGICATAN